jgi:tRNA threonylcarbamoyl adenosine modification protein YeaZ
VLILAFDTATPAVTVALVEAAGGGCAVRAESTQVDPRRHGELLAPAITDVLGRAGAAPGDLTDIAVGLGPGPYTGLRVGVVTALALGDALGRPVRGVCTLDILARAACRAGVEGPFLAATDARRKEVYWAAYDASGARTSGPSVDHPSDVPGAGGVPAVGAGAALYADVFGDVRTPEYPGAAALGELVALRVAEGGELLPPEPLYLRRPDARAPGAPKKVSVGGAK